MPEADAPWEAAVSELVVVMAACAVAEERRPRPFKNAVISWLRWPIKQFRLAVISQIISSTSMAA